MSDASHAAKDLKNLVERPLTDLPPLPDEPIPSSSPDDGWQAILDEASQRFYYFNKLSGEITWRNPRAADGNEADLTTHAKDEEPNSSLPDVAFQVQFNKRTGRFVRDPEMNVESFTSDGRGERQLKAFFDPDTFNQEGKSFRAERAQAHHTKKEMQEFKRRYKEKREEKKRGWLTMESDDVDERRKRKH